MFDKVIVGFDGSDHALDALLLGQALTACGGEMIVCCVHHFQSLSARVDPTEPRIDRESAEKSVKEAARLLDRGLSVTWTVLAGASTATSLQRTAVAEQGDLIVLGSSHRGALGRVLVGSVTEETLHQAPCPVAIAPAGFRSQPGGAQLTRIAVGVDGGDPVPSGLAVAQALCEQTGAELRVVAVADNRVSSPESAIFEYTNILDARRHAGEQAVAGALSTLPDTVSALSEVRDGRPVEQLLEVTSDVDLLVLTSHGRGFVGRLAMGSVCDLLVRAAACPVLVVPPSKSTDAPASTRISPTISSAHGS
ncbi:MAG TPA: universal stress protein [Solirubrobacteraceae bacterium]|jgi:nucleotide-binding universal stress UspA family protein